MRVAVLVLSLVVSATAFAQTNSERADYENELKRLKANPAKYQAMRQMLTLMSEVLLGRLGYSVGPFDGILDDRTEKAIRAYEKTRGIPVTGNPLSFQTMNQVQKDMDGLDYRPIGLPHLFVYVDDWEGGYFSAQGTWTISGEEMASPEQTSTFRCYRSMAQCIDATATVGRSSDSGHLSVDVEWYDIERWDNHEIVTKPKDFVCARYVRRVNRVQKTVTGIRSTISTTGACSGLDAKDKLLVLSNGFDVYLTLLKKANQLRQDLLVISPELTKAMADW